MNDNLTKHVLTLLFLYLFLPSQGNSQESFRDPFQPQLPNRAFLVFDGVNACKPDGAGGYVWEQHVQHMGGTESTTGTFEYQGETFAAPFTIMATSRTSAEELAGSFDTYLDTCKNEGTTPFVVFAPRLNIEGYLASLGGPAVLDLILARLPIIGQATGQKYVQEDIAWIREVAPIILSKLKEAGYEIDGVAHSWGASLVVYALLAARDIDAAITLRHLLCMNGRKDRGSLIGLEIDGLVDSLTILSTSGDALTYFGKAAFGKGHIFIVKVYIPGWDTMNPVESWDIRHNAVTYANGSTKVVVEVNGVRYEMTLRDALLHLPSLFWSPKGEKAIEEFLEGKRKKSDVRSTATKDERGNPTAGVEAGPVVATVLVPALTGQIPWRGRSILDMRDLLPTSGPSGTTRVGPLPVDHVLEMGNAVEAAANEFRADRRVTATKAVVLVTKTPRVPYEHDYPICPRFHLKTLTNLAAVPLPLGGAGNSDAKDAWFWFSSFYDKQSGSVEVGCHFAVFVTEANRDFTVDSRWVDKQYCPYWRDPQRRQYDYILNFQVWSYSASETMKLVRSVLKKLERLPGNWKITYANQEEPTQPTVFIEEAWLSGNTVYLSVWNRSSSLCLACLHGTKQLLLGGRDLFVERWEPVYPGRTVLQLPLGPLHNAVLHCEVDGFLDKVFVSVDKGRGKPLPKASLPAGLRSPDAAAPKITIFWPPDGARVRVLRDHLDMPPEDTRLAINGAVSGAPSGSRLQAYVGTTEWFSQDAPTQRDGVWGARAYLSGEGARNDHRIYVRLVDASGKEIAKDSVKGIVRIDQAAGGRPKLNPMEIGASKFGNRRGVSTDGKGIIIGGGQDGPYQNGGSASCQVTLPEDASGLKLRMSIWHGTQDQFGKGVHSTRSGGQVTIAINGVSIHSLVCRHQHLHGDYWPERQPELVHDLPEIDCQSKGIRGRSLTITITTSGGTCMDLRSLNIEPTRR